jgi:hypothetical protein
MVVTLDDAKIQVTLDVSRIDREVDRSDRRREDKGTKKRKDEIKKEVKKQTGGLSKHKSGRLTKGTRLISIQSKLAKGAATAGIAVAVLSAVEQIGPALVNSTLELIGENFATGGRFGGLGEFAKEWFDIDLEANMKAVVEEVSRPWFDKIAEWTSGIDETRAGIDAVKETANFARQAAILGRPPGFEKISSVFDDVQAARYSQLRTHRFVKRESTEAVMGAIFAKAGTSVMRYFGAQ